MSLHAVLAVLLAAAAGGLLAFLAAWWVVRRELAFLRELLEGLDAERRRSEDRRPELDVDVEFEEAWH